MVFQYLPYLSLTAGGEKLIIRVNQLVKNGYNVCKTKINHPKITINGWYKPSTHGWFLALFYQHKNPIQCHP